MKASQLFPGVVGALFAVPTAAIALQPRQDGLEPRVLSLPMQGTTAMAASPRHRRRRKRDTGASAVNIDNLQTYYLVNSSIGTPAQSLRFHLDTGSSDLWTNTATSTYCESQQDPCSDTGTYNANKSSTYKYLDSLFSITYNDGSAAKGDYVTDTFQMGSLTVDNLQFGIGYQSSSAEGVLGIGYTGNEAQVNPGGNKAYANLPQRLKNDGVIASNAYSIYLDDLESSTGSILFGGIDREKFDGQLLTMPIQQTSGQYLAFAVTLNGLAFANTSLGDDLKLSVILDTGSTLTYLPDSIVTDIYDQVGAEYDEQQGTAIVPCSLAQQSGNMTFQFSSPLEISVPMSELVFDLIGITGHRHSTSSGQRGCMFGIAPAGSGGNSVLGDTFLRSAYVVFDLDNNEISMAQSNFEATKSDVLEIGSGKDAVPSATGVASSASSSSTGTGKSSGAERSYGLPGPVTLFCVFSLLFSLTASLF